MGSVEDGSGLPELFPPTRLPLSPVWDYFGYPKNADGVIEENEHPRCKACRRSIISKQGILANMLRHLKFHHNSLFAELKLRTGGPRQYKERRHPSPVRTTPDELYPPKMALRSAVWKYFGYLKNSRGIIVPDGFPVCKLCLRKVSAQGGSTTNMMVHLQRYHLAEFAIMKLCSEETDDQVPKQTYQPSELHPPRDLLEPVWEHFGYPKDTDGVVQVDGRPVCKLCGSKVSCVGEDTKFLYRHLWKKHNSVYHEVKVATNSFREEEGREMPVLYPPTQKVKSAVWEYFGYLKDTEGAVVCDGFPICKLCQLNVSAKGGNTSNMFKHLKDHHKDIYDEIRPSEVVAGVCSPSELYAPDGQNSKLWDYFGYTKNVDGVLMEDGAPVCKICVHKLMSRGGTISNMMKHLLDSHDAVYAEVQAAIPTRPESELEPLELHLPTSDAVSPVWKYFGYLKDMDGAVVCDGFPICKICQQKVVAKAGNTTNMLIHLRAYHLDIYKEVKPAVAKKVLYRSLELYPPNGQSDIKLWDHFGYPRNAEGVLQDDRAPICKLCLRKLIKASSDGTPTTNMLRHLRKKHQAVYEEVQEAITALRTEWGIEPPELHPPTQNVTSPVWQFFGYLKDAQGSVVCDGFPI
uniref:BED-type domain-containing protein n=1 Tax=Electrophorus electricus TaxID=8005 RepID=A0AAY5EWC3_ELEEL